MITSSDLATFTARVLASSRSALVVSVDGEVDRANEGTLRALVGGATGDVVVDLRRARFVSSSVFGCLLDEGGRLGRRIRLVVPGEGVAQRTLRLLGLSDDFDVHTDVGEALDDRHRNAVHHTRGDAGPSRASDPSRP